MYEKIVGLRSPNATSGVGLFNRLLGVRLGIPCGPLGCQLDEESSVLLSLKFEELNRTASQVLAKFLASRNPRCSLGVFLHTLSFTPIEAATLHASTCIYAGNDHIYDVLCRQHVGATIVKAFAPPLVQGSQQLTRDERPLRFFHFGMANKLDRHRLARLTLLLHNLDRPWEFHASLVSHEAATPASTARATQFLSQLMGPRLKYLGTLSDHGLHLAIATKPILVAFFPHGARTNNTTLLHGLSCQTKIITNLDAYSPLVLRDDDLLFDLDTAMEDSFVKWLDLDSAPTVPINSFSWQRLVLLLRSPSAPITSDFAALAKSA